MKGRDYRTARIIGLVDFRENVEMGGSGMGRGEKGNILLGKTFIWALLV